MQLQQVFISGTETDDMVGQLIVHEFLFHGSISDLASTRELFVADGSNSYQLIAVTERHSVVGSTSVMITKVSNGLATVSGQPVLASTIPLTTTTSGTNYGTIIASTALTQLAPGDEFAMLPTNAGNLPPIGIIALTLQRL